MLYCMRLLIRSACENPVGLTPFGSRKSFFPQEMHHAEKLVSP